MAPIFWAGVGVFALTGLLPWLTSRPTYIGSGLVVIAVWWALLLSGVGS